MRTGLLVLWMLLCSITSAAAQVNIGIGLPGISIGINIPVYPQLIRVPGYPVYYAPQMNSNYFFYDGMYWVYDQDNWYASIWYNGPWELVAPETVPLFILRIPVRYYRQPPSYFRGWNSSAPPRWGEHWGNAWEERRRGWDNWNRSSMPPPAPLPVYQRQYSANKYPPVEQQQVLQSRNYRYKPQDSLVRQHYPAAQAQSAPSTSPQREQAVPQARSTAPPPQRGSSASPSLQAAQPSAQGQAPQKSGRDVQRPAAAKPSPEPAGPVAKPQTQQPRQATGQRQQKAPAAQAQDKGLQAKRPAQEPKAQQQTQQPRQATGQRQQQAPRAQAQDKGAQGKAPEQEPKQGQQKGRAKVEQRDKEGSK